MRSYGEQFTEEEFEELCRDEELDELPKKHEKKTEEPVGRHVGRPRKNKSEGGGKAKV